MVWIDQTEELKLNGKLLEWEAEDIAQEEELAAKSSASYTAILMKRVASRRTAMDKIASIDTSYGTVFVFFK